DGGFWNLEMVEQRKQVFGVRVFLFRPARSSEPSNIVTNHLVMFREDSELFVPHPTVEKAGVNQNERRSVPFYLVVELAALNVHKALFQCYPLRNRHLII